jgi:hypothetical protein
MAAKNQSAVFPVRNYADSCKNPTTTLPEYRCIAARLERVRENKWTAAVRVWSTGTALTTEGVALADMSIRWRSARQLFGQRVRVERRDFVCTTEQQKQFFHRALVGAENQSLRLGHWGRSCDP